MMDFPAYVPFWARKHICYTLEGSSGPGGFAGVNAFVREYSLRSDMSDALEWMKREQACVTRFAHDKRMQSVYFELQKTFTRDEEYRVFLAAAFNAHQDYGPYRERVKKAKELAPKIAAAARELARLLNEAGEVGGGAAPSEFFSVRRLLDETEDSHMAALGIDRFVAERSLNHKLRDVEGTYNRYDYFAERRQALAAWAQLLKRIADGEPVPLPLENRRNPSVAARRAGATLTGGLRGVAHDARDRHPAQQRPATVVRPTARRHADDRPGSFDDLPAGRPR